MFRIRRVPDDTTPANRQAIEQAQAILSEQFSGMPDDEISKLPDQLHDPMKYRFRTILFVAEDARDRVRGCAVLMHAPDLKFCYLETISAARGGTGGGVGAALYERVREMALALDVVGIFLECLPDDSALSPEPAIRKQNIARLRFYERFGARPIINTAYATPLKPGDTNPPYLVFDDLGRGTRPGRDKARAIVRAILERKYSAICPPDYVNMVVKSFKDDPIQLRAPRYLRRAEQLGVVKCAPGTAGIPIVVNDRHLIHHVRERGYVESPLRIRSIIGELDRSGLFVHVPPTQYSERHIRAVHDGALVDYLEKVCRDIPPEKSVYPYTFPIRNVARPPKDLAMRAGYFCIDTFTPLNSNAWKAARRAVDCTLTAAQRVVEGAPLAYALVRPPGHHAERRAFGGFCYFNNSAIAAHYLSQYGRVAVLDIDYHHGNGTQDIFYHRADVLTVSIHGHPSFAYPYFSGFKEEVGRGPGAGFNLNIPLPETISTEVYREALKTALRRVRRHDPAFLVLAVGFDTAKGDPTGTWPNQAADFAAIGRILGETGIPTVVVQEGGYRVRTLGTNARNFFMGLADGLAWRKAAPARPARRPGPTVLAPTWREAVTETDIEAIRTMVAETGVFITAETAIAAELAKERVGRGRASGYEFVIAEQDGRPLGYTCYGPIAGTDKSFDLYWIVVARTHQRSGLGRQLMARTEAAIAAKGGARIYIETSSTEAYEPTRRFYRAMGYRKVAELPNFYRPGDGKIVYLKELKA